MLREIRSEVQRHFLQTEAYYYYFIIIIIIIFTFGVRGPLQQKNK